MPRPASISIRLIEDRLGVWLEKQPVAVARPAESAPVRRDMATLLAFVRDEKVVGTQGTGNMPLKAVAEVSARFVNPPPLEATIGNRTYRIRSEEELWPLYFLHILADVGGLIQFGRARRWRLTANGERFLDAQPVLQVAFLLAVWWYRVNWLVAYSYTGMGNALPDGFQQTTLVTLRSLPAGTDISFDEFADKLIDETGLTWGAKNSSVATIALRSSIHRMVISMLDTFGVLNCRYTKEKRGQSEVSKVVAFKVTPLGNALLDALVALES
ncbi:MAG: hypothetical protein GXY83_00060 [Rhodopirellula sp.]|nr:hypothetical protein [Rhodopirellula sp.]